MLKSEVLLYGRSKLNATAILYKLAICKGKIYGIVLYQLAILLTHFMKEYFNSFDDIQFFSGPQAFCKKAVERINSEKNILNR